MIYKETILPGYDCHVQGTPLHVNSQRDQWQVWFIYDATKPHQIRVVGTGPDHLECDEADGWKYINTFLEQDANFVWHAFSRRI